MSGKLKQVRKSSMLPKSIKVFQPFLKYFKRRIIIHDIWLFIQSTVWIVGLILLILTIAGRLWPIPNIQVILFGIICIWIFSILINLFRIPKSSLSIAWRVDQELSLKERFSSSIEFSGYPQSPNPAFDIFIPQQREETLQTLKSAPKNSAFRLKLYPKHLIATTIISVIVIILTVLPNPMTDIIKQQEAIAAAAEAQAEKIDELREEILQGDLLSEEEKEDLINQLESLAAKLRDNQGDLAEAMADLSKAEAELLKQLNPQLNFKQAALNSMSQQLSNLAKENQNDDALNSDFQKNIEDILSQLSEMDEANLENLSQSLQKMAALAAQAGEPNLAETLSSLSQSVLSQDSEASQENGEKVAAALNQFENKISNQENIEKILSQLQKSRLALSQSSSASNSGQPSSQGNQNGQNDDPGQGQNPGSGQNPSQGNPGAGGGTKANTLPGFTGSGQANDPNGQGQGSLIGDLEDQIYVPWDRLQGDNDPLSISGQDTGQGQMDVKEQNSPLPGINSFSLIPYTEVYKSYLNTAYDTIENSYIPIGLKEYIMEYFSSLEP
ncbi:MAG: hypothetical protein P8Y72_11600 [Anaerolineales bacterium]